MSNRGSRYAGGLPYYVRGISVAIIVVKTHKRMPRDGRFTFTSDAGGWSFVKVGSYGPCKSAAIAAYKRDVGSTGTLTATHRKE